VFTGLLPSNGIHIGQGFMKFATEMGLDAIIYIPNFIKTGSFIQKLIRGVDRQNGNNINLLRRIG
jgi:hypothetical protein